MVQYEWQRVADDLAQQIDSGRIPAGAALPSILRLAQAYGVADHTVRRALQDLRERGLIETLPHKGSYVAEAPPA
ncbi:MULTISPECIES: winged helix-turn-helix domain-containing protein [unclassified Streptomyces]|uniref:winged helix-turn-helix domain-containing protein n=1 Tax=unclassified Streptomyces TaxID=2593676 RepID=UPI000CD4EC0A|nr:winged helix-turn-helix domain-containing protein [Streptomyces sp. SM1]